MRTKMKTLHEELEEVVDKHVKNRPETSEEVIEVVRSLCEAFGHPEKAVLMCLIALSHSVKLTAEICKRNDNELAFIEILSDPFIKMIFPYCTRILTCKRFEK